MASLHNLKPEKVIKAFEKAGWMNKGQRGSHMKRLIPSARETK
jgi:predicted RNA binding protein YcfA (HicA-like mRNA interferase family)